MTKSYTRLHFDFDHLPWLTNPRTQLELQGVALGLIHLPPNEGYTFTHKHREQEEVYIVISGSGFILIDDELIDICEGDIIRVSPDTKRALKAKENGIFVICSGAIPGSYPKNPRARYTIDDGIPDYDDIPPWYSGNPRVVQLNKKLKKRMNQTRQKKESRTGAERNS